jgi:hypothetical protein
MFASVLWIVACRDGGQSPLPQPDMYLQEERLGKLFPLSVETSSHPAPKPFPENRSQDWCLICISKSTKEESCPTNRTNDR